MANELLIDFIKKAKEQGFTDIQIRKEMIFKGWPLEEINKAYKEVKEKPVKELSNQVTLFISDDILSVLQKRAKKNLFTISEQIEDILRRSCMKKGEAGEEKIDDRLLLAFSRKNTNKKKKKKKIKKK